MEPVASIAGGLAGWSQQLTSTPKASARLVRRCLSLAEERSRLNCFIELFEAHACAAAELADESAFAGLSGVEDLPLLGIPFAIKDIYAMEGHKPSGGSRFDDLCEGEIPSPLVSSFVQAGAIVLGTTNLDELCYGMTGLNARFGTVRNPLDETRIAGGSSSGSAAAVAAGIVPFALGSDTGGSIRVPAACCGIVGFKPSHGLLSLEGAVSLSPTQDCVGWLTPSVSDARLLFQIATGRLLKNKSESNVAESLEELTFGIFDHPFFATQEPTINRDFQHVVALLRSMGAIVKTLDGSFLESCDLSASVITGFEAALLHRERLKMNADMFSGPTLERLRRGQAIGSDEYDAAIALRAGYLKTPLLKALECDFFLAPTLLRHPPAIDDLANDAQAGLAYTLESLHATRAFSFLGGPIISLPLITTVGLPTSIQIAGALQDDTRLLRVGEVISKNWANKLTI